VGRHDVVAGEHEALVAAAVVFEGVVGGMGVAAVGFGDECVLAPEEVGLVADRFERDVCVDLWSR
jgi:hypothetical protein